MCLRIAWAWAVAVDSLCACCLLSPAECLSDCVLHGWAGLLPADLQLLTVQYNDKKARNLEFTDGKCTPQAAVAVAAPHFVLVLQTRTASGSAPTPGSRALQLSHACTGCGSHAWSRSQPSLTPTCRVVLSVLETNSTNTLEYFAQLSNAWLSTNTGFDPCVRADCLLA